MNTAAIDRKELSDIRAHLIIGLLCLPLYQFGGELFKFVLAPYILYMLFSMKAKYIPALLLHFMDGTTMSFLILIGCLVLAIKNYKELKRLKISNLLWLTLIPLPLLAYTVYIKMTVYQEPFLVWIIFLFMYLGLFPFFYFALLAPNFKTIHLKYIFIVLALAVFIQFFVPYSIRYVFFSFPVFFTLLIVSFKDFSKSILTIICSVIIVLLIVSFELTSTLVFTSLIAVILSFYYLRKKSISLKSAYLLLVVTLLIVINSISTFDPTTQIASGYDISNEKLDVLDFNSVVNRVEYKLLEDRTPLWFSVYQRFVVNGSLLPPEQLKEYDFITLYGNELETELPAHNIFLELIKQYGILSGVILSIAYIIMIIKSSLLFSIKKISIYLLILSTCVLSCGFFGAMTGQYLLLGTFSFLFIGLSGLCYGIYKINNSYQI